MAKTKGTRRRHTVCLPCWEVETSGAKWSVSFDSQPAETSEHQQSLVTSVAMWDSLKVDV